jgi:hypothetical protein
MLLGRYMLTCTLKEVVALKRRYTVVHDVESQTVALIPLRNLEIWNIKIYLHNKGESCKILHEFLFLIYFLAHFPYLKKYEEAYEITNLSVHLCICPPLIFITFMRSLCCLPLHPTLLSIWVCVAPSSLVFYAVRVILVLPRTSCIYYDSPLSLYIYYEITFLSVFVPPLFCFVGGSCRIRSLSRYSDGLRAGNPGFESQQVHYFSSLHNVQTGCGAQTASCLMDSEGDFPEGKTAGL